jgi:hypothetical protein
MGKVSYLMGEISKLFDLWKRMFSSFRYVVILVVVGFFFYMLNGLLMNVTNIGSFYNLLGFFGTLKVLFFGSLDLVNQLTLFAAFGTVILSVMVGMLVSLLSYRYSMRVKTSVKGGVFSGIGMFLGVAAPGCAACGIGILSLLGLTSALVALPFDGHEVIVLAIGAMSFSIIGVSKKFYKGCDLGKNMFYERKLDERGNKNNE